MEFLNEEAFLPRPVRRLQPGGVGAADSWRPPAGWPEIVYRRDGWHALRIAGVQGANLIFLKHIGWEGCWIDMTGCRLRRVAGQPPAPAAAGASDDGPPRKLYRIGSDFDIAGHMAPLRTLVDLYRDQNVTVLGVTMGGVADERGVILWPESWQEIKKPARKRKEPAAVDEVGTESEDSLEDLVESGWSSSSGPGIDTDSESEECAEGQESEDSDSEPIYGLKKPGSRKAPGGSKAPGDSKGPGETKAPDAHKDAEPGEDEKHRARNLENCVWRSDYFYIRDTPGWDDVKALMFQTWATDKHMFRKDMSKRLKPHLLGEPRDNPVRTYLLLRAWMLWRARRDGWAGARPFRRREFDHQEARLKDDIKAYRADLEWRAVAAGGAGAAGGAVKADLLGNDDADLLLQPALCEELRA